MATGVFGESCISLHRVMIHDRGGVRRMDQLVDVAAVKWTREEGQITGAEVTVSGVACRLQAPFINSVTARRHEVVIWRGADRVWEGPIAEVKWYTDRVVITARDVGEYLKYTPLSKAWPNSDDGGPVYMTERIAEIIEYELTTSYSMETNDGTVVVPRWEELDPPINVLPFLEVRPSTGADGIRTLSSTLPFEMMVGEHLANLADGGLDFATVGRRLLIWDRAQSIGKTRTLTEADFYGDLEVIASGTEYAAIAHISAQRDPESDDPLEGVGNAGEADDFYGVWTRLASLASEEGADEPEQTELNSQARRQLVGRSPVPTEIVVPDGAGLRLSHDLTINMLVPGVIMPVRATLNLHPVAQDQRLDKLTVTETPAGEQVQVSLSPAGVLEGA